MLARLAIESYLATSKEPVYIYSFIFEELAVDLLGLSRPTLAVIDFSVSVVFFIGLVLS